MNTAEVRAIVHDHMNGFLYALRLKDWHIGMQYRRPDNDAVANCEADTSYRTATITIDPAKMEDEYDVVFTLRHELLHCLHCQFEVYRKQVFQLVHDTMVLNALDQAFNHACEVTVTSIEDMLDIGLGFTPAGVGRRGAARELKVAEKKVKPKKRRKK